ncbi:MAG TPA: nuclear transport factor 2 family protein [Longimicrobiaceae bacterium]|nr:nuclear transport factor 2 family protein [Longimicrobiaceae bacterium]
MKILSRVLLPAVLAAGICTSAAHAQMLPGASPDYAGMDREFRSTTLREVNNLVEGLRAGWQQHNARSVADLYTDNAVLVLPEQAALHGHKAIEQGLARVLPHAGGIQLSLVDSDVSTSLAFTSGEFYYEDTSGEASVPVSGTYTLVMKGNGRGGWKIRSLVFNPTPAAPAASATATAAPAAAPAGTAAQAPAAPAGTMPATPPAS